MNRITLLTATLLILCTSCGAGSASPTASVAPTDPPEGVTAIVERIIDGDSIEVLVDGERNEVRLIGINAPEGTDCLGDEARDRLSELVAASVVILVGDGEDMDQYGRLLRYVFVGSVFVNGALVDDGMAIAIHSGNTREDDLEEREQRAFERKVGLWASDACGPAVASGVGIVDVAYDPPGPDDASLDGEIVTITNSATTPLDLGGWTLRDESTQNRYRFPPGSTLDAGGSLVVVTGCGTDRAQELFWCAPGPVWSNGGDTALLLDPAGNVVARFSYPGNP